MRNVAVLALNLPGFRPAFGLAGIRSVKLCYSLVGQAIIPIMKADFSVVSSIIVPVLFHVPQSL